MIDNNQLMFFAINSDKKEDLYFQAEQIQKTYSSHFVLAEPIRENKRSNIFGRYYLIIRIYKRGSVS